MNLRFLFLVFFGVMYFGHTPLLAQSATFSGTVQTEDGKPFPGATIRLSGTGYGAVSDINGHFIVRSVSPNVYQVIVSAVGYLTQKETISLKVGETLLRTYRLREESMQTDEVVITAARREQLNSEAPVSIAVLGAKDIEVRNIVQLDDALRYTPGVQLSDNQVNVRGSTGFSYGVGSRIQFLVDGVPMLNADTGGIAFNLVPTAQIKQVEVIKGPGSALYGGGALGGVINVITKDFPEKPETSFRSYAGVHPPVRYTEWKQSWTGSQRNRYFWGANISRSEQVTPKLGYWVNVNYAQTEGYFQNSDGYEGYLAAKLGYQFSSRLKTETLVTSSLTHKNGFVYWASGRDALRVAKTSLLNGSSDNEVRRLAILPVFTFLVNPSVFISLKNRFYGGTTIPIWNGALVERDQWTTGVRFGSELQANIDLKAKRYLIFGAGFDQNATNSKRFFGGDDTNFAQPEWAVFGQYEQQLLKKINLVAGFRLDRYEISSTDVVQRFSPKFNVSYTLNPALNLRVAWGYGFRVPGITERYVNNSEFLPVIPNTQLRPEISNGYEAGLKGFFALPIEDWGGQYDVAAFSNQYTDLVEPKFQNNARAFQFVNLTKGQINGVDASVSAGRKDGRLLFNLAYLLLDGKDRSDPNNILPLNYRSKHLLQASISVSPLQRLEVGLDFRYASAFERVDSDFGNFIPDATLHLPIKVWDARLRYDFGKIQISLLAKNAGEYYYMERPAILAPTRNFILQLQGNL
ncbi:MAG: TonB-dependent receptor [Bacteroidetes Order II. Incertae sedis bacterium]|nr:TonB-dependent receptor [Bacteroidetes Order II. bacterium]